METTLKGRSLLIYSNAMHPKTQLLVFIMNIYTNFDLRPLCSDHEEMRFDAASLSPSSGPQRTPRVSYRASPSPPRNQQTSPAVVSHTTSLRSLPSFSSEFEYDSSHERAHLARFLSHQPSAEYDSDNERSAPTTRHQSNGINLVGRPSAPVDSIPLHTSGNAQVTGGKSTSSQSPKRERGPPPLVFEEDSDDDLLIPKPPGEVGRPNRGGYSLYPVLGWPKKKYDKVKLFINELVEKHLDCTAPMSDQALESVKKVRIQAVEKFDFLKEYRGLWVIDDFIRNHLKYRKTVLKKERLEKIAAEARPATETASPARVRSSRNR
ncbi:hypothetical protein C8R42DRAFT_725464 [Lentinula raphanica]|nr:hypothetical protein C8R42DRAFT_725464 [Lentinula raphanica]